MQIFQELVPLSDAKSLSNNLPDAVIVLVLPDDCLVGVAEGPGVALADDDEVAPGLPTLQHLVHSNLNK